jgi:hypothetical protein
VLAIPASARADAVTDWNQVGAAALQSPGTATPPGAGQGAASTAHLAMVHAAAYDAVNAIAGCHEPYVSSPAAKRWYSQDAAVAAAAHHVLVNGGLGIPAGRMPARGRLPGSARADPGRAGEGRRDRHGRSRRGRPARGARRGRSLRAEVKAVGRATGSTRTPEQTAAAEYWGTTNATATMASIIRSVASGQGGTLADHARLLARVYTNAADALIVTWRDKARYSFWRPFHAIREAAGDGNRATEADPDWTALIATPPYPEHPGGLSTFGGAVADTMQDFYGRDEATFSGTTPGGVTRQFTSFSQVRDDIVEARIWSGVHFRFADTEGAKIGRRVAHWGNHHAFR